MKSTNLSDVGTLFNLLTPENRDLFFGLLRALAEPEASSPDAPDPENRITE